MIKIGPITLHTEIEQGSDEWHMLRAGSIGSSDFATAAATGKAGKESKTRNDLLEAKVIAEATGAIQYGYSSEWMGRGKRLEGQAAEWLEQELSRIYASKNIELIGLVTVGMMQHDVFPGLHSSPDRLVDAGLWPMPAVEIKCPKLSTHLKYLSDWVKNGLLWHPSEYRWQIKVHRAVCGSGCWFCSWHPDCDAQVLSWIPPATEAEKQEVMAVLDRWRVDSEAKKKDIDNLLVRINEDEQRKEVETAALIEAAKKQLLEVAI